MPPFTGGASLSVAQQIRSDARRKFSGSIAQSVLNLYQRDRACQSTQISVKSQISFLSSQQLCKCKQRSSIQHWLSISTISVQHLISSSVNSQ
jgi:hypothetical protein